MTFAESHLFIKPLSKDICVLIWTLIWTFDHMYAMFVTNHLKVKRISPTIQFLTLRFVYIHVTSAANLSIKKAILLNMCAIMKDSAHTAVVFVKNRFGLHMIYKDMNPFTLGGNPYNANFVGNISLL